MKTMIFILMMVSCTTVEAQYATTTCQMVNGRKICTTSNAYTTRVTPILNNTRKTQTAVVKTITIVPPANVAATTTIIAKIPSVTSKNTCNCEKCNCKDYVEWVDCINCECDKPKSNITEKPKMFISQPVITVQSISNNMPVLVR